jgi:hypothetical protein
MPPTYSGTKYNFAGQPTVRCPDCGRERNRLQVHRVIGGGISCVFCIRRDEPPLARSVVLWAPGR